MFTKKAMVFYHGEMEKGGGRLRAGESYGFYKSCVFHHGVTEKSLDRKNYITIARLNGKNKAI